MSAMKEMDSNLAYEILKQAGWLRHAYLFGDKTGAELLAEMKKFIDYADKKYDFSQETTK